MDFDLSEAQQDLRDLATQILEGELSNERLKEIDAGTDHFDRDLWAQLAGAGLLGVAVPEEHGGLGLGYLEAAVVLEQIGRTVAPVPYLPTVVLGALPVARFAPAALQAAVLPGVAAGTTVLTAALVELAADPLAPTTTAARSGDGWALTGQKDCVPAGLVADRVLVPASTADGGVVLALVDPTAAGVTRLRQDTTNGDPEARLILDGVVVADADVVAGPADGAAALLWLVERATAAQCVVMAGVAEAALRMTAEYTKTREQFDRPIATFQAVGQRAADAYIDTEAIRLTAWQAVWRLAEDLPAAPEVAVAKFWAAEGGQRVVHAAQHLHGGMGVDRDYPLHRYFLLAKKLELSLGGTSSQLVKIGAYLADLPA